MLVFDAEERKPDALLRYQFETVSRLSAHGQDIVRELLDAVIIKKSSDRGYRSHHYAIN